MSSPVRGRWALVGAVACLVLASGCSAGDPTTSSGGREVLSGGPGLATSSLTCAAPTPLPGTTVHVALADLGASRAARGPAPRGARMLMRVDPASVPAGRVTLVAENLGWRTHDVVVLPMRHGDAVGRPRATASGRISLRGQLGEASASCAPGRGSGIEAGTVGWTTLRLSPGRYDLVGGLPNDAADGMHAVLTVR